MTAPIVGATKLEHLEDALAAEELELSEDEVARLEEPYVPHAVAGHPSAWCPWSATPESEVGPEHLAAPPRSSTPTTRGWPRSRRGQSATPTIRTSGSGASPVPGCVATGSCSPPLHRHRRTRPCTTVAQQRDRSHLLAYLHPQAAVVLVAGCAVRSDICGTPWVRPTVPGNHLTPSDRLREPMGGLLTCSPTTAQPRRAQSSRRPPRKASSAFNSSPCARFAVPPLEFHGTQDQPLPPVHRRWRSVHGARARARQLHRPAARPTSVEEFSRALPCGASDSAARSGRAGRRSEVRRPGAAGRLSISSRRRRGVAQRLVDDAVAPRSALSSDSSGSPSATEGSRSAGGSRAKTDRSLAGLTRRIRPAEIQTALGGHAPPPSSTSWLVATPPSAVTPAHATSACSSMSPEHAEVPSPPLARMESRPRPARDRSGPSRRPRSSLRVALRPSACDDCGWLGILAVAPP